MEDNNDVNEDGNANVEPVDAHPGDNGDGAHENQLVAQGGHHLQGGQHPQGQHQGIRERLRLQVQQANQQPDPVPDQPALFLSFMCRTDPIPPAPGTTVLHLTQLLYPLQQLDLKFIEDFANQVYAAREASATGTIATVITTNIKDWIVDQYNTDPNVQRITKQQFDGMSDTDAFNTIFKALAPRNLESCITLATSKERSIEHDDSGRSTLKLATYTAYRKFMRQVRDLTIDIMSLSTFKKTFLDNLNDPSLKTKLKVFIDDPTISAAELMDFCIEDATAKQRSEFEITNANSSYNRAISALVPRSTASPPRHQSRRINTPATTHRSTWSSMRTRNHASPSVRSRPLFYSFSRTPEPDRCS